MTADGVVTLVSVPLLLACCIAFWFLARELLARDRTGSDWRHSFLLGSLIGGSAIVAITEILSLFSHLQRGWLLVCWGVALLAACGVSVHLRARNPRPGRSVRTWARRHSSFAPDLSALEIGMLAVIAVQVFLLAIVALAYPPNNYDSMTYHMARIAHWEQERSVAFYPSGIMMQVRGAPFAEYAITQPQLLLGRDWLANLVQWYAMILCAVGVSALAAEFGADRPRQIASALFSVSIPMGILQATSTQNDYVLAAWMVCFLVCAYRFLRNPSRWLWIIAMSVALGLAILTKQTALAYAPWFAGAIAVTAIRLTRWRAIGTGFTVLAIVLAVNAGFLTRTVRLYGSPLGPSAGLTNEVRSIGVTASNSIRNLAINLSVSTGLSVVDAFSAGLLGALEALHGFTGFSPADPRTTLTTADSAFVARTPMHEDLAGNFVHVFLSLAAMAACGFGLFRRRPRTNPGTMATYRVVGTHIACVLLGFVFFSFYFKWQTWNTRLHLTLFVLMAPAVATVLFAWSRRLLAATAMVVGLLGFAWTSENVTRPLKLSAMSQGRAEKYFANRPDLWPTFRALTEAITQGTCSAVGLRISSDPFEYPLWILLRERDLPLTVKHIESHELAPVPLDPGFRPCAIVSAGPDKRYGEWKVTRFDGFYLYEARTADGPAVSPGKS